MKAHEVFQSEFLKAADLSDGGDDYHTMLVTITDIETSKPFDDGNVQRMLTFKETPKKLGLNKTNWNSISRITKQDDDENWKGARLELWVDPEVQYAGKTVPAIRIRKVSVTNPANASAQLPPVESAPPAMKPVAKPQDKNAAWASWKSFGGNAADFKSAAEALSTKTNIDIADFGPDQWQAILDSFIPF